MTRSARARARFLAVLLLPALLVAPLLLAGCGDDGGGGGPEEPEIPVPPAQAVQLTNDGWTKFEAGDYAGAVNDFTAALTVEGAGDYIDALSGRGWSRLRMSDYAAAAGDFVAAVASADYWQIAQATVNARVGQAITASRLDPPDFDLVATATAYAVEVGGEFYRFSHDTSIQIDTVRFLRAEALIRLQRYLEAYNTMVEIDVTVLDRIDPRSEQFVEMLVLELERMGASV